VVARTGSVCELAAIRGGVLVVVAAEATRKIGVPDVIRIRAPIDLHGREYVATENGRHGPAGASDLLAPTGVNGRVIVLVILLEGCGNRRGCLGAARVRPSQDLHASFLGGTVGQRNDR